MQRASAQLRAVGGSLPTRRDDLARASWAAHTAAATRDPIADDRLSLAWLVELHPFEANRGQFLSSHKLL